MQRRSFRSQLLCVATAIPFVFGTAACTHTRVDRIAKYEPGSPTLLVRPPKLTESGGVYKVKYATADDPKPRTLPGSKRIVGPHQLVGFERGDTAAGAGQVIAVAGKDRFSIALPPDAKYCYWYGRSPEPSAFAKSVQEAVPTIIIGAVVVGVVGLLLYTSLEESSYEAKHPGHHHEPDPDPL